MIYSARLNVAADRWTPWVYVIKVLDINFTGATMQAQIRLNRDAPGVPLVNLTAAAAGLQGISFTVSGGETTITLQIDELTMEGLPAGVETGDDVVLYWDLQITPSSGKKAVFLFGTFTAKSGVTY